jgi:hypothetical protein
MRADYTAKTGEGLRKTKQIEILAWMKCIVGKGMVPAALCLSKWNNREVEIVQKYLDKKNGSINIPTVLNRGWSRPGPIDCPKRRSECR